MTHEMHIYILKMEAMLLDENYYTGSRKGYMNIQFELQYKAVAEFKWSFYFFCVQATSCQLCDGSWVHRQRGQENQVIITLQLSVFIAIIEKENINIRPWDSDFLPEHCQA